MRRLTIVHPIPPYDKVADGDAPSINEFLSFLDAAQRVGLGVLYDFRGSYTNLDSVKKQVAAFKDHPALLLWYTADEPDQGDAPEALISAYELIKSKELDNKAHPVALVLNCNDFNFDQYARGADVIAQDAYPVSANTTYSRKWNTTCTLTHGDCGCDQCGGYNNLSEASVRAEVFRERLEVMESVQNSGKRESVRFAVKGRTPIWAVTQGFGSPGEYWPRGPTVNEFIAMAVGALARSVTGIMPWVSPSSAATSPLIQKERADRSCNDPFPEPRNGPLPQKSANKPRHRRPQRSMPCTGEHVLAKASPVERISAWTSPLEA